MPGSPSSSSSSSSSENKAKAGWSGGPSYLPSASASAWLETVTGNSFAIASLAAPQAGLSAEGVDSDMSSALPNSSGHPTTLPVPSGRIESAESTSCPVGPPTAPATMMAAATEAAPVANSNDSHSHSIDKIMKRASTPPTSGSANPGQLQFPASERPRRTSSSMCFASSSHMSSGSTSPPAAVGKLPRPRKSRASISLEDVSHYGINLEQAGGLLSIAELDPNSFAATFVRTLAKKNGAEVSLSDASSDSDNDYREIEEDEEAEKNKARGEQGALDAWDKRDAAANTMKVDEPAILSEGATEQEEEPRKLLPLAIEAAHARPTRSRSLSDSPRKRQKRSPSIVDDTTSLSPIRTNLSGSSYLSLKAASLSVPIPTPLQLSTNMVSEPAENALVDVRIQSGPIDMIVMLGARLGPGMFELVLVETESRVEFSVLANSMAEDHGFTVWLDELQDVQLNDNARRMSLDLDPEYPYPISLDFADKSVWREFSAALRRYTPALSAWGPASPQLPSSGPFPPPPPPFLSSCLSPALPKSEPPESLSGRASDQPSSVSHFEDLKSRTFELTISSLTLGSQAVDGLLPAECIIGLSLSTRLQDQLNESRASSSSSPQALSTYNPEIEHEVFSRSLRLSPSPSQSKGLTLILSPPIVFELPSFHFRPIPAESHDRLPGLSPRSRGLELGIELLGFRRADGSLDTRFLPVRLGLPATQLPSFEVAAELVSRARGGGWLFQDIAGFAEFPFSVGGGIDRGSWGIAVSGRWVTEGAEREDGKVKIEDRVDGDENGQDGGEDKDEEEDGDSSDAEEKENGATADETDENVDAEVEEAKEDEGNADGADSMMVDDAEVSSLATVGDEAKLSVMNRVDKVSLQGAFAVLQASENSIENVSSALQVDEDTVDDVSMELLPDEGPTKLENSLSPTSAEDTDNKPQVLRSPISPSPLEIQIQPPSSLPSLDQLRVDTADAPHSPGSSATGSEMTSTNGNLRAFNTPLAEDEAPPKSKSAEAMCNASAMLMPYISASSVTNTIFSDSDEVDVFFDGIADIDDSEVSFPDRHFHQDIDARDRDADRSNSSLGFMESSQKESPMKDSPEQSPRHTINHLSQRCGKPSLADLFPALDCHDPDLEPLVRKRAEDFYDFTDLQDDQLFMWVLWDRWCAKRTPERIHKKNGWNYVKGFIEHFFGFLDEHNLHSALQIHLLLLVKFLHVEQNVHTKALALFASLKQKTAMDQSQISVEF